MNLLEQVYFGNPLYDWIVAVTISIVLVLILHIVKRIILRRLTALSRKTENRLDDYVVDILSHTRFLFLFIVAFYFGMQYLELPPKPTRYLDHFAVIALLVQVAFWGNRAIAVWLKDYLKRNRETDAASATTASVLGFMGRVVLWSVLLLMILGNLGFDITALVASLGIGGIAVALALQNILGDIFASLSIALDKPFVIGDFIIVDEVLGTVEYIGLKTTRLRSLGGEQIVFSNNDLLKSRIRNYKRMFERRVVFGFGVVYQTTHVQLKQIPMMVREIIQGQEKTRFDRAHFKEYGDSSLDFEVVYYVLSPNYNVYMDIQQAINLAIFEQFAKAGIDFAYPTRTLYVTQDGAVPAETRK
ncbi:MAG: mechanosensitive ion channel family protein [Gammaproteobacteria bacterium]|nr:mechanosensitive ion channel family protein [Gammaproteobacteria bacterium]MDH3369714.1 mechanosensitive ion channel family protein [Gammaproteobacteria bacterium]MDH3407095.1 mechanosensitive ion channel family protein [Gammaproteobacteria bacterium]MDH3561950.1 mechanosensitive ion channel family protein [Gammaproteobacteria bacterium]MDH5486172.1 mechanosensitive ion channel family protein [Gammaproteobacteria bacterium]